MDNRAGAVASLAAELILIRERIEIAINYMETITGMDLDEIQKMSKRMDTTQIRKRCMGPWPRCGHVSGECTADPVYQSQFAR